MEYLEIEVYDDAGKRAKLRDFLSGWTVLYFYPKDNTPGCTTEALEFHERLEALWSKG